MFAEQTYVETGLEEVLLKDIQERKTRLVILCGNAGDGKTALLQRLSQRLGLGRQLSSQRIFEGTLEDGLRVRVNLDGSAAWKGRSADDLLDEFLAHFQNGQPASGICHLLAINDGRLLEWIEGVEDRRKGESTVLTSLLRSSLDGTRAPDGSPLRFVDLNQRSLVGGMEPDRSGVSVTFLERLVDHLYGGDEAAEIWEPCRICTAKIRCEVYRAQRIFLPGNIPTGVDPCVRKHARERLFGALQAVHLRGEVHITARELRTALIYILFGVDFCSDYHARPDFKPSPFWDRAFDAESPGRQGEVLGELLRLDPSLEAHPQIDRWLQAEPGDREFTGPPHYGPGIESARRRAYFEWTKENVLEIGRNVDALGLARGRHLTRFQKVPMMSTEERAKLIRDLCGGISRLEDMPPLALERGGVVPLKVIPRTPTETVFWVEKPLASFRIEADLPPFQEGLAVLHRQVILAYRYKDRREEKLRLGSELFHLLLELSEGYQLGDASSDETFTRLSIFVQRLVQEDERRLMAWNPIEEERLLEIVSTFEEGIQKLVLKAVDAEEPPNDP